MITITREGRSRGRGEHLVRKCRYEEKGLRDQGWKERERRVRTWETDKVYRRIVKEKELT